MSTTTTTELTIEQVARKAVELADAKPGFVYDTPKFFDEEEQEEFEGDCQYLHHEDNGVLPGCLYGHAFLELGLPVEKVATFENNDVLAALQDLGLVTNRSEYTDECASGAIESLPAAILEAQRRQDASRPWGEAVEPLKAVLAKVEGGAK